MIRFAVRVALTAVLLRAFVAAVVRELIRGPRLTP